MDTVMNAKKSGSGVSKMTESKGTRPKLGFHPSTPLMDAFLKYQTSQRPRISITAALQAAVEEFLTARGYWPPEDEEPAPRPAKKGR